MTIPMHLSSSVSIHARGARSVAFATACACLLLACTGGSGDADTAFGTRSGGSEASPSSGSTSGGACTEGAVACSDGTLTACEDGVTKTVSCEEQCQADGFEPGNTCWKDGTRCACGNTTDAACTAGVDATCTCLDGLDACQGANMLDMYTRCHRDKSSEEATLLACFAGHMSGGQVACNTAILACGDSAPSGECTADVDCGHCERCERSTGKCITRLACD
jgi:hypothetical protein